MDGRPAKMSWKIILTETCTFFTSYCGDEARKNIRLVGKISLFIDIMYEWRFMTVIDINQSTQMICQKWREQDQEQVRWRRRIQWEEQHHQRHTWRKFVCIFLRQFKLHRYIAWVISTSERTWIWYIGRIMRSRIFTCREIEADFFPAHDARRADAIASTISENLESFFPSYLLPSYFALPSGEKRKGPPLSSFLTISRLPHINVKRSLQVDEPLIFGSLH